MREKKYLYTELDKLMNVQNDDLEYVSLYYVLEELRRLQKKYNDLKDIYVKTMNIRLKNYYNYEHYLDIKFDIILCGFNYDRNELYIVIRNMNGEMERYYFKKNEELVVTRSVNGKHKNDILFLLKNDLSDLYDKYLEQKEIRKQCSSGIGVYNSKFKANVGYNAVELSLNELMSLRFMTYCDDYFIESASNIQIDKKVLDLLNHSYVKKCDLPFFIQEILNDFSKDEFKKIKRLLKQ